jgi:hypothetical protein
MYVLISVGEAVDGDEVKKVYVESEKTKALKVFWILLDIVYSHCISRIAYLAHPDTMTLTTAHRRHAWIQQSVRIEIRDRASVQD